MGRVTPRRTVGILGGVMSPGYLSLLGFSAPVVKADVVELPVITGSNERVVISATPGLMRQFMGALNGALPGNVAERRKRKAEGEATTQPRPPRQMRDDSKAPLYRQIEAAHAGAPEVTYTELCRQAGAKPTAFFRWRYFQRRAAKTHAGAPITKPSGSLL